MTLDEWIEVIRDAEVGAQESLGKLTARMGELATAIAEKKMTLGQAQWDELEGQRRTLLSQLQLAHEAMERLHGLK